MFQAPTYYHSTLKPQGKLLAILAFNVGIQPHTITITVVVSTLLSVALAMEKKWKVALNCLYQIWLRFPNQTENFEILNSNFRFEIKWQKKKNYLYQKSHACVSVQLAPFDPSHALLRWPCLAKEIEERGCDVSN